MSYTRFKTIVADPRFEVIYHQKGGPDLRVPLVGWAIVDGGEDEGDSIVAVDHDESGDLCPAHDAENFIAVVLRGEEPHPESREIAARRRRRKS